MAGGGGGGQRDAGRLVDFSFEAGWWYALRIEFTNNQRAAWVIFGFHRGYEDFSRAVELARQADVAVVCMGDSGETCGENFDRVFLGAPGRQRAYRWRARFSYSNTRIRISRINGNLLEVEEDLLCPLERFIK